MGTESAAGDRRAAGVDGPRPDPGPARRGLGMTVVMAGVLMTAVDGTIVVLALPALGDDLGMSLSAVVWVVIGYLLTITLLATQVGRLGDVFGRVRMYEVGFAVFVVGSLLCALSWNAASIIVFRLVQGLGAALVTANSGAVIADLYPPEQRGRAYGFNAFGWTFGAVLGVLLGGVIITYSSWQWIFWINVPIGVVVLALALRVLRERGERVERRLDVAGMLTLGAGLFGVLWAMTRLTSASFDATEAVSLGGGLLLLVVFVVVELRQRDPMLDLSLFRIPTLTPSLLAALFQGLASFAVLFLLIMYLQGVRGLSPIDASLLLVPGYLVGCVVGPYAGRLSDAFGSVVPAVGGLVIQAVSLVLFAELTPVSGLWVVVVANIVNTIGISCFFPANSAAVMRASPPSKLGIASGVLRTFGNIGMLFSFTTAILVASSSVPRDVAFAIFVGTRTLDTTLAAAFTQGLRPAFYTMIGFTVLAAVLSALRGSVGTRRVDRDTRSRAAGPPS